jgi:hypothetical protein
VRNVPPRVNQSYVANPPRTARANRQRNNAAFAPDENAMTKTLVSPPRGITLRRRQLWQEPKTQEA